MHIKRFKGRSVKEAMKLVKEELGDNALIIDTRKAAQGGYVEILAAVDYEEGSTVGLRAAAQPEPQPSREGSLLRELRELKQFVISMMQQDGRSVSRVFTGIEEELVQEGLERTIAREFIFKALAAMRNKKADVKAIKEYIKARLIGRVSVEDPFPKKSRTFMAFVGPTGAGKTSTIAKLASIQALKEGRKVALFTMDTYRAGATEQLAMYGKIIGVPVHRVDTVEEFVRAVEMHPDKDSIFLDTAGRSLNDGEHIRRLKELTTLMPSIKLNLVISVQTHNRFLCETLDRYGRVGIDYLTFTKLDEGGCYGTVFTAAIRSGKPLTYFTTGQQIPDDIERATTRRLSTMILNKIGGTDGRA